MPSQDWSHIAAVTRVAVDGTVTHFNSLAEAVANTDISRCTSGRLGYPEQTFDRKLFRWFDYFGGDPFIFRDELGFTIPPWKLQEADRQLPPKSHRGPRSRRWHYDPANFRQGAVPGVRKRRRGGRSCTNVRTFTDRRENDFVDHYDEDCLEYRIKARPCRGLWALPNSWDDRPRGRPRCWKAQRRTQYKVL